MQMQKLALAVLLRAHAGELRTVLTIDGGHNMSQSRF